MTIVPLPPAHTPALTILLELEASPQVFVDCLNEGEEERLEDWVNSQPDLLELVLSAIDLRAEARAA